MFSSKRSPLKAAKHSSVDPPHSAASASNFFDSDDEKDAAKPSRKSSSEPNLTHQRLRNDLFSDHHEEKRERPASRYSRSNYKNDFRDSGGLENQSVQELEDYAVYKAEETTKAVNGCLKIAEDMRGSAVNTMEMLHHQGDQITRTHRAAADIDHDLSRGEKLLGSLGGMFSKTWKPKKTGAMKGPAYIRDDVPRKGSMEQREKLGLASKNQHNAAARSQLPEADTALSKVEVEKAQQDDALSDLSNILDDLKDMATDMGHEFDRQNKALDPFSDDVDKLNDRVQGAVRRGHHLLRK